MTESYFEGLEEKNRFSKLDLQIIGPDIVPLNYSFF